MQDVDKVNATRRPQRVSDQELALLLFTQVKGSAKAVSMLEVEDLEVPEGLQTVWQILDQSHGQLV